MPLERAGCQSLAHTRGRHRALDLELVGPLDDGRAQPVRRCQGLEPLGRLTLHAECGCNEPHVTHIAPQPGQIALEPYEPGGLSQATLARVDAVGLGNDQTRGRQRFDLALDLRTPRCWRQPAGERRKIGRYLGLGSSPYCARNANQHDAAQPIGSHSVGCSRCFQDCLLHPGPPRSKRPCTCQGARRVKSQHAPRTRESPKARAASC